jgi:hypothetical protein
VTQPGDYKKIIPSLLPNTFFLLSSWRLWLCGLLCQKLYLQKQKLLYLLFLFPTLWIATYPNTQLNKINQAMLKRTKGRLLLTLLVITGLAGTLNDTALTEKERKFVVHHLKDTKADVFKSIKGLSDAQFNFKAGADRWSIKECVYHITLAENSLWTMFEATMKLPPTPEKRSEIKVSDEDIVKMVTNRTNKFKAPETIQPDKAAWQSVEEAAAAFKAVRGDHQKYAKTTTEDLRNHVFQLPFGMIDGYQFLLFMSAHSARHTQQIYEVKADPDFPKQ